MAGDQKNKKFNRGDLVWARVKGFPPWPAKVTKPKDDDIKIPTSGTHEFVTFYGSDTYSFVHPDLLWSYEEFREKYLIKTKIPEGFQDAVDEIEATVKRRAARAAGEVVEDSSDSSAESESAKEEVREEVEVEENKGRRHLPRRKSSLLFMQKQQQQQEEEEKNDEEDEEDDDEIDYDGAHKHDDDDEDENIEMVSVSSSSKKRKSTVSVKSGETKKRKSSTDKRSEVKVKVKKVHKKDKLDHSRAHDVDRNDQHVSDSVKKVKKAKNVKENEIVVPKTNEIVEKFLSLSKHLNKIAFEFTSSTFLPDVLPRPIQETFTIGFLGLGKMGTTIVNRLLNSGLKVMVWNRTPSKCKYFMELGAEKGSTPSEVVQTSDITISCVSDARALKDLISGTNGVLESISPGKSFVDMSTVDVLTVTELHESITSRGGKFLESPIIGSLDSSMEDVVVVASGDKELFDDCCSTVFNSISKKAFYLGGIGSATCMKLVVNMLQGTLLAGLAETLALGEKLGLDQSQVLNILTLLPISSQLNSLKGDAMITNQLSTRQLSLEHMQRDIRLAISLGELVQQPLYITTATNELFKKAKARGYGDHDTAAIYRATD
ncbi:hypothetical protein HELRODRAFT_111417 [Helobdella robusta]|uniref:Cytokine-like nuclear factor N-PAC n=1 Tax=Helobdella robusta TaxID=6412 RepID=T1EFB2_HELRO|nr:hypothetical protein HELRODRAFT_111417 [Helobdella robusta]ESO04960.1 hypothetical protein HELRODRAFT_111417 [Helobdella robusta]